MTTTTPFPASRGSTQRARWLARSARLVIAAVIVALFGAPGRAAASPATRGAFHRAPAQVPASLAAGASAATTSSSTTTTPPPGCTLPATTAAPGFTLETIASPLPSGSLAHGPSCTSAGGSAFNSRGEWFLPDIVTGGVYAVDPRSGGRAEVRRLTTLPFGGWLSALAFGPGGELYALQTFTPQAAARFATGTGDAEILQLDPRTGAIVRIVAENLPWDTTLAVDPVSGDLFLANGFNAVVNSSDVVRVHDPGPGAPPVDCAVLTTSGEDAPDCSVYAQPGSIDTLSFAPDGTLYARGAGTTGNAGDLWSIGGTASADPGAVALLTSSIAGGGPVDVIGVPGSRDGALAVTDSSSGALLALPLAAGGGLFPAAAPKTLAMNVPGDVVVGRDGCLYIPSPDALMRLATAGGACTFGLGTAGPAPVSSLASSLPSPGFALGSVGHDAAAVAVAAGATLFITFPAQLFNRTFEENYEELATSARRRLRRLRNGVARRRPVGRRGAGASSEPTSEEAPLGPLGAVEVASAVPAEADVGAGSARNPAGGPVATGRTGAGSLKSLATWRSVGVVLLVGALFGGLLDPSFGLNVKSLEDYVAMVLNACMGIALSALVAERYRRYRGRGRLFGLKAIPAGLLVALVCVVVSRVADFQPGYLYGVLCGTVFAEELVEREEAHILALSAVATMLVAIAAWVIWGPVNHAATAPGASVALVVLDDLLAAIFVGGLTGTVIGMLPLSFLPGGRIVGWHRGAWAATFGASAFALVCFILWPRSGGHAGAPLVTVVVLLVFFGGGSVAFWWHFERRKRAARGGSPPRGCVVAGAPASDAGPTPTITSPLAD